MGAEILFKDSEPALCSVGMWATLLQRCPFMSTAMLLA